ncbi:transcription factor TFIIIC subunit tfc4 [Batrachochytrium dendrobatidis]
MANTNSSPLLVPEFDIDKVLQDLTGNPPLHSSITTASIPPIQSVDLPAYLLDDFQPSNPAASNIYTPISAHSWMNHDDVQPYIPSIDMETTDVHASLIPTTRANLSQSYLDNHPNSFGSLDEGSMFPTQSNFDNNIWTDSNPGGIISISFT